MTENLQAVTSLQPTEVSTAAALLRGHADPDSPLTFVLAGEVPVGATRVWGGVVTEVRTSPSGKTVYITDDRLGTEKLSPATRIAVVRPNA